MSRQCSSKQRRGFGGVGWAGLCLSLISCCAFPPSDLDSDPGERVIVQHWWVGSGEHRKFWSMHKAWGSSDNPGSRW